MSIGFEQIRHTWHVIPVKKTVIHILFLCHFIEPIQIILRVLTASYRFLPHLTAFYFILPIFTD